MCSKLYEREVINGKTYGGRWYFFYAYVYEDIFYVESDPYVCMYTDKIKEMITRLFKGLEIRHSEIILTEPGVLAPFSIYGTLGVKFFVWGRAYKIMRLGLPLEPRGCKSKKKKYLNGRRVRR